jgi:uncharacterized protein with GYD domain
MFARADGGVGTGRVDAARQALASAGGEQEAFYFAFGNHDFYMIVDLPDNVRTTEVTWIGNVCGTFNNKTAVLLTPEELDQAIRKKIIFRPLGRQVDRTGQPALASACPGILQSACTASSKPVQDEHRVRVGVNLSSGLSRPAATRVLCCGVGRGACGGPAAPWDTKLIAFVMPTSLI